MTLVLFTDAGSTRLRVTSVEQFYFGVKIRRDIWDFAKVSSFRVRPTKKEKIEGYEKKRRISSETRPS